MDTRQPIVIRGKATEQTFDSKKERLFSFEVIILGRDTNVWISIGNKGWIPYDLDKLTSTIRLTKSIMEVGFVFSIEGDVTLETRGDHESIDPLFLFEAIWSDGKPKVNITDILPDAILSGNLPEVLAIFGQFLPNFVS